MDGSTKPKTVSLNGKHTEPEKKLSRQQLRRQRTRRAAKSSLKRWAKQVYPDGLPKPAPTAELPPANNGKTGELSLRKLEAALSAPIEDENSPFTTMMAKPSHSNIQKILPRRQPFKVAKSENAQPPTLQRLTFSVSFFQVIVRLFILFNALFFWYREIFKDKLFGRDSLERRAVRLREIIEHIGGSAIKIGQQMAMRIDLLPYAYSFELSKLLDKIPPFATEYAIKRVEASIGKKLAEVFEVFDPVPIGSASVGCVYQAILKNGEKVAVKVRRPNIGETFAADCQALEWMLGIVEFLTLIRPGLSQNFLYEFRHMLLEELDFKKEARYTELFRREVKKRFEYITAPRIYFEYCSSDVIVSEFVSGIWLGEVMGAVESKDEAAIAYLRGLNIDAKVIAKRLIKANQFGVFEATFFHADPHPSNVLVQPNNRLVFIDFGACGAYSDRERHIWRQMVHHQQKNDIPRMVQCVLAILEPLPEINIDEFAKKLENVFWQNQYALASKHYQWFERTSATLWLGLLELSREYNMSLNLNTLRTIRSTLLYETLAARLYNKINIYKEIRSYNNTVSKEARKRVVSELRSRINNGLKDMDFQRLDQIFELSNRFVFLAQRFLDAPPFRFTLLSDKRSYTLSMLFRAAIAMGFVLIAATSLIAFSSYLHAPAAPSPSFFYFLQSAASSKLFLGFASLSTLLYIRRILFRLSDKHIQKRNASGLN